MKTRDLLELSLSALNEVKGKDISCLEVSELTDLTDFMVIVTGNTIRQVRALADNLIVSAKRNDVKIIGVEGYSEGDWTLVDLGDLVVHIMLPEARKFYDLEKLWAIHLRADTDQDF
ncbi:MAG: ribosome silencing factor [Gammaproteobacteria bacterium]|nr:ribosome silencing factor [Gammaproteobacteria bacterium]|tara:strand:+ start:746 stop:1096 length:351 start_codon:yes stop_codon:yes gene_type:complete